MWVNFFFVSRQWKDTENGISALKHVRNFEYFSTTMFKAGLDAEPGSVFFLFVRCVKWLVNTAKMWLTLSWLCLCRLPISHTCFNQICLPPYRNRKELKHKLTIAISNSEGFGLEWPCTRRAHGAPYDSLIAVQTVEWTGSEGPTTGPRTQFVPSRRLIAPWTFH